MASMLDTALHYHSEGLNVIPVVYRDKKPALSTWEEYHTRMSTEPEIREWFNRPANVGIVHGEVSGNYITIDIDHDAGVFADMMALFSPLFRGRIEQSGSGQGFHIPFRVSQLPDFGHDSKQGRPRGNRTWKTKKGDVNIRARFCQTLAPPSVHPSGGLYQFIQNGELVAVPNLDSLIEWLGETAPPPREKPVVRGEIKPTTQGATLIDTVKAHWQDAMAVFREFGLAGNIKEERNSRTGLLEYRLLGHGGLLVTEDRQKFYCFSDEIGGGLFEAWGYCRFGSSYDSRKHFRKILLEMAEAAGIDPKDFYKQNDEQRTMMAASVNTSYWGKQYTGYWQRAR